MSQQVRVPTPREWEDWLEHPGTKGLKEALRRAREQAKEAWARGAYQVDSRPEETTNLNAGALGNIFTINYVLEMDYDKLVGELSDE